MNGVRQHRGDRATLLRRVAPGQPAAPLASQAPGLLAAQPARLLPAVKMTSDAAASREQPLERRPAARRNGSLSGRQAVRCVAELPSAAPVRPEAVPSRPIANCGNCGCDCRNPGSRRSWKNLLWVALEPSLSEPARLPPERVVRVHLPGRLAAAEQPPDCSLADQYSRLGIQD